MIINPKNLPSLSCNGQEYFDYLQKKLSLLCSPDLSFNDFVDVIYSLGQVRQEIMDDENLLPQDWLSLHTFVEDSIEYIKACGRNVNE